LVTIYKLYFENVVDLNSNNLILQDEPPKLDINSDKLLLL